MDTTNLVAYLPFDSSTTEDLCENTWTAYGSPTIEDGAIHLPSGAYLTTENVIDLSVESKWTFMCKCKRVTSSGDEGFFGIGDGGSGKRGIIVSSDGIYVDVASGGGWQAKTSMTFPSQSNVWCHLTIVKNGGSLLFFEDGQLVWTATITAKPLSNGRLTLGGNSYGYTNDIYLDEVLFYDGVALHTENFTPPTAEYYAALKLEMLGSLTLELSFDIKRKVINADKTWRYENEGTADKLTVSGTTLTDLPESKSITGTAFYQTQRAKCFDLPATNEIWAKFDVYFDGSNRWRAYNGGTAGDTGVCVESGNFCYFINQGNSYHQQFTNVQKTNQLQTVLLHMVSGTTGGVVEAWVDGTKIYTYTGNVNHGQDFSDLYLQSDGSGTFFSNVIISNKKLDFGDGWHSIYFDVERDVTKQFEINFDVERELIAPIYVPFIGEHFNHIIGSLNLTRGGKKKIILPKKSSVYIRATGDGAIRIFSDTDREGKKTGEFYAQLDECNTVFIVPTDSPPFAPQTLEITNLLISDGATDSDYEALTDNTRQIFAADILRALYCSFEGEFDIAILSVLTVKVLTDVLRNIIAQVNLFARQKEEPFNPDMPEPTPIDLPVDTKGIRDFEVTIAEQQISDQVRFTAVTPYDVQQEISGQYLDYKYNMVIERVQQQGILHSCECFSNINDLLYTQLNYKIPPITSWYKINGEQVGGTQQTVEIKTVYPLASTHATSIAKALKLKAQIQFDDFLSTVLMDEKGGVTYNDLIRDIFGWSSRVPTMLINVFPRDGKLFFIQRGHETHSVDITQSKHTVPVITREIVRTSYGSSVESTTTINEYDITANTFTPDTIVGGEEGGDDEKVFTVQDKAYGNNWSATTTYEYSTRHKYQVEGSGLPAGLLLRVEINKSYDYGSEESDSYTQILHDYDSDGTRIGTETYVHYFGGENRPLDTRNINRLGYITLPGGEKYLARESTERYEGYYPGGSPTKLIDSTITTHSPSRLGQTHVTTITDDGIAGGVTGQNTGDDRITPYSQRKAQNAAAALASVSGSSGTWEETTTHHESGMTTYGLALYDSSFPIHDDATLKKIKKEMEELNGSIKETVTVTVYDLEHLIDFADTITFGENEYFLVSNTARTTPRILLEQNLTLVRWIY